MHKIGDYVVYGGNGVMSIVDIREECFGNCPRCYYILRDVNSNSASLTYVPVDNEALVAQMRSLLTKDEIFSVIRSVKDLGDCEWAKDSRSRAEIFKKITESGDRGSIIAMIRTIYNAGLVRESEGKKNFISDENAMIKAKKLLVSEFSLVLEITEEETLEFLKKEFAK